MPSSVKVFDAVTTVAIGDSYEILNGTDFTPGTESIQCTSGMIWVVLQNTGTDGAQVNLEWSPDNSTWVTGVEIKGGTTMYAALDRIDTGPADTDISGMDPIVGEATQSESCAMSFKVKGKYVRLRVRNIGTGGCIITAWMGAV